MKKKPNFDKYNSLLGVDAVVEGNFSVKDSARIDGTIRGDVTAQGNLVLGPKGTINGNIKATDVEVGGKIVGNVTAGGRVFLTSTAHLTGDIVCKGIIIDENAVFQGKCDMGNGSSIATAPAASPEAPAGEQNQ
ncbi:MAG: polymer-forming cytoskeletal protein [Lachnospiraceae bacterium]|nr:polymer-forming cytoskeletal protein [Lachnospiraceae bacterium]